ncbi:hypothetical protein C823_001329 [Eubacterium plexicaudatum ASF492]|nr:hypothetical protein C823_001329 [Eubacterium plexicaudatum ASF492]
MQKQDGRQQYKRKVVVKHGKEKDKQQYVLLIITIVLFVVMYVAGMILFNEQGFAKPQMFLNLFISNAGLIVIGCGMTLVMITGGIDISVGSVTALVCMVSAYIMENKGMSAWMAVFSLWSSASALVSYRDISLLIWRFSLLS